MKNTTKITALAGYGEVVIDYDSQSLEQYLSKWDFSMGFGEMAVNDNHVFDPSFPYTCLIKINAK